MSKASLWLAEKLEMVWMANEGKRQKEKPKRKLPKKSKRSKRRYVLFSLENCPNPKMAFDLVMGVFSLDERKKMGLWFIGFKPDSGKGIVRCFHGKESKVRAAVDSIPNARALKTSGTLKALKGKISAN